MTARWELFCRVIDNFGDAGIAWRLARELHDEHGLDVTIWIDAPDVLLPLAGTISIDDAPLVHGIHVRPLAQWRPADELPAVIVDVLGASIPRECVEAMHYATSSPPHWFVLEYLSAEPWVEDHHGMPSPHPATGIARRFWFPGFTPHTAGLLRERDLFVRREAFRADGERQRALWRALRVEEPREPATRVSLFCYPHAPVRALLHAFSEAGSPITCYVPQTAAHDVPLDTAGNPPRVGQPIQRGALVLHVVPFVPQERYDELLWACDINFVRGEDSFVRAQWAARPLVWHIYRQEHDAHAAKLDAFVNRYAADLTDAARTAVKAFWGAWNGPTSAPELARAWHAMIAHADELERHAVVWAARLARLPELATTLVQAASGKV